MSFLSRIQKLTKTMASKVGEEAGKLAQPLDTQLPDNLSCEADVLQNVLPYRYYDDSHNAFINQQSIGFAFHIVPAAGADETLVQSLAQLIRHKLPLGWHLQCLLLGHNKIAPVIDKAFAPLKERGGLYQRLAERACQYHKKAVTQGYANRRQLKARLCDYECYLFLSLDKKGAHPTDTQAVVHAIEAELRVARLGFERIDKNHFLTLLRYLTSPDINSTAWDHVKDEPLQTLNEIAPRKGTLMEVEDDGLCFDVPNHDGTSTQQTQVISLDIDKFPDKFALWQSADSFANLFRCEKGIPCSFVINFSLTKVNPTKASLKANRKYFSLEKKARTLYAKLFPNVIKEAGEWQFLRGELAKDNVCFVKTFFNVMLLTKKETAADDVAQTIAAFRYNGIELIRPRYTQFLNYLATLPFMMSEGIAEDLSKFKKRKTLTHWNAANLLPLVADMKGSSTGVLLPTFRHQLAFFDNFDDKHLPITNYNMVVCASTGSGKSVFCQQLIIDAIGRGRQVFVIDLGESYKHLCQMVGGAYIDASTLALNPFTLFEFKDEGSDKKGEEGDVIDTRELIRDLLALMASPNTPVLPIQRDWLLEGASKAWEKAKEKATIDDVIAALGDMLANRQGDVRLSDLITHLSKYGSQGIYGHLFNRPTPLLDKYPMVVLELGAFESRPELLKIVLYTLIVIIQGQFYHSGRERKKICLIDEAWRFLAGGDNDIAAQFIQAGFRTARKYQGAFVVITQLLNDLEQSLQGRAIKSSSDIHAIMRQGSFDDYLREHPDAFDPLQQSLIKSFGEAKTNGFSEMMLKMGNAYSFNRLFLDPFSRVLFSSSGEEFSAVEKLIKAGASIDEAVHQVSQKLYREDTPETRQEVSA